MSREEKKIKIIKEGDRSYTALIVGRLLEDKRHTTVQFWGRTEKQAINKLQNWAGENNVKLTGKSKQLLK